MSTRKSSSLPQGWAASNLESVVTFFTGGTPFLKSEYVPTGTPVLTKGDVKPFGRIEHSGRFVDTGHAIAERYRFTQPGDLLVTTRDLTTAADFLGLVAPVPADRKYLINQGANVFRLNGDLVDARYFVYWASGIEYRNYIKSAVSGSTQVHIRKADWLNAPLHLPPKAEQQRIACVLGALDDKIELNRRMNVTLEAMARALFQSWFVDFDPVRAKASGESADSICQRLGLTPELLALFPYSFEDSELGEIPLGWQPTRLDEVLELAYGKALKATDRLDGSFPVYGSGGVTGFHNESLIEGPAIIVGRKGTVGSLYWEDRSSYPIDTVFYVRPKMQLTYCFYLLKTLALENMNTDAAVPGLNRNNVYRLLVSMPSEQVRAAFERFAKSVRSQICANTKELKTLSDVRDTLLPKLLSGELVVSMQEGSS